MSLQLSIDQSFEQAVSRACRLVFLQAEQAPKVIIDGEARLLDDAVAAMRVMTGVIVDDIRRRMVISIEKSCPCFFCGHHQEKKAGPVDLADPDTFEFYCVKGHALTDATMALRSEAGCLDYTPEGAVMDRRRIPNEVAQENARYAPAMVARAFRAIGQAMVDGANQELGE